MKIIIDIKLKIGILIRLLINYFQKINYEKFNIYLYIYILFFYKNWFNLKYINIY